MGTLNTVDVTVITCLYGETHDRFLEDWFEGIKSLQPFPSGLWVIGTDRSRTVGSVIAANCDWSYPQAFYLQKALEQVDTDWVWIHDIDDVARPDALQGIEKVEADVWQLGYRRSDGVTYLPPQLEPEEVLNENRNPFVAGSCVRTAMMHLVGGFPDCALQDWALWRRIALAGGKFLASDRVHFNYRRHEDARGERELTQERRDADIREMLDLEGLVAYTA